MNIKRLNNETWFLLGAMFVLLLYLSPYLIWGQDCIIRISDNLDSNIPWQVLMSNNIHKLGWNYKIVQQAMTGVPRAVLGGQLNVISLLYLILPPFVAYVTNLFMMHFIAFIGMLLLLKKLSVPIIKNSLLVIYGVALCFAIIDFWPSGGLSVAGQPLLLYAILNFKSNKHTILDYLIVLLFPFYSSLVLAGFFILISLGSWLVLDIIKTKKINSYFFLAIVLLGLSYLITRFYLFKTFFSESGFISQRTEFYGVGDSLISCVKDSINLWLFGLQSHANVQQWFIILLVLIIGFIITLYDKMEQSKILYKLIAITLIFSFISGFVFWTGLKPIIKLLGVLKSFDFSRFSWLLPTLFYLIFFYSLTIIKSKFKKSLPIIGLLIFLQIGLEFKRNSNNFTFIDGNKIIHKQKLDHKVRLTYRQYYSVKLFKNVTKYIGKKKSTYKVICLGIDPGVLQYNGFYTLDAYFANYPLKYKHEFKPIIEKELLKNKQLANIFNNFGSTCYMFSAELKPYKSYTKFDSTEVQNLEIDTKQIKLLGGEYIISTVKINDSEALNIKLEKTFEEPSSLYNIYLYKII